MSRDIRIGQIDSEDEIEAVRGLVREFFAYARTVDPDADKVPAFAGLEAELAGLPGKFGPPHGAFLLVTVDGEPAGCGGFFDHGDGRREVKRMYVRPGFRGQGVGEGLVAGLIERARSDGAREIVLSTYYKLAAARRLYERAGFRQTGIGWQGAIDPDHPEIFMLRAL